MLLDRTAQFRDWPKLTAIMTMVLTVVFLCASGCRRSSPPNEKSTVGGERAEDGSVGPAQPQLIRSESTASVDLGKTLYAQHCAACHGQYGDGQGIAAAYLFPKPRDFTAGRFRLVSTTNRVPSPEDLEDVLLRGMPGSAMPPWAHLKEEEIKALTAEVIRLHQDGTRAQFVRILKEDEELTDEEIQDDEVQQEITTHIQSRTTPGPATDVPPISVPDEATIARGKDIYMKQGCNKCHGDTGRGDGQEKMVDDEGYPTGPRDFTKGIFKGGHDVASIYRRIAYGMPGTPMPSSGSVFTPAQMVDLAHFTLSLSSEEQRQSAILERKRIAASFVNTLPKDVSDDAWSAAELVRLRVVPLWWRDQADPDLQVRAVHDGKSISLRISWRDDAEDGHAARSESFEDAVAMEIYRGDAEPFFGMGDPESPIDVWFWDADRQGEPVAVEDLYPNTVVDLFPFSETAVAGAELDRKGARTADQPEISLPARASGNPIMPTSGESGASSLTADGPGSVTFRIPKSQLVTARGQWADGRWTVVMTRSLAVESETDGLALEPGVKTSVAFAIWDGSQQDRDGKKSITIWNDLELKK